MQVTGARVLLLLADSTWILLINVPKHNFYLNVFKPLIGVKYTH